jgi:hypothetical protein
LAIVDPDFAKQQMELMLRVLVHNDVVKNRGIGYAAFPKSEGCSGNLPDTGSVA